MTGPSTVLPSHAELAAGCCVLDGAAVVAAGCATTAGVVDETGGGVVAVGPTDEVGWVEVGSVESGPAAVSPPRSAPRPPAASPDGRSSNATRPDAAEVSTSAGSSRLPSEGERRAVIGSPPRLLEVDVVGRNARFTQSRPARPQQPLGTAQQCDSVCEIGYGLRQHLSRERVFHRQRRGRADEGHQLTPETLSHLPELVDIDQIVVPAGSIEDNWFVPTVQAFEHRLHRSHADA